MHDDKKMIWIVNVVSVSWHKKNLKKSDFSVDFQTLYEWRFFEVKN